MGCYSSLDSSDSEDCFLAFLRLSDAFGAGDFAIFLGCLSSLDSSSDVSFLVGFFCTRVIGSGDLVFAIFFCGFSSLESLGYSDDYCLITFLAAFLFCSCCFFASGVLAGIDELSESSSDDCVNGVVPILLFVSYSWFCSLLLNIMPT